MANVAVHSSLQRAADSRGAHTVRRAGAVSMRHVLRVPAELVVQHLTVAVQRIRAALA